MATAMTPRNAVVAIREAIGHGHKCSGSILNVDAAAMLGSAPCDCGANRRARRIALTLYRANLVVAWVDDETLAALRDGQDAPIVAVDP